MDASTSSHRSELYQMDVELHEIRDVLFCLLEAQYLSLSLGDTMDKQDDSYKDATV